MGYLGKVVGEKRVRNKIRIEFSELAVRNNKKGHLRVSSKDIGNYPILSILNEIQQ